MTENMQLDARPCSVCAALVPADSMTEHLQWHDSILTTERNVDEGREADPAIADR